MGGGGGDGEGGKTDRGGEGEGGVLIDTSVTNTTEFCVRGCPCLAARGS